MIKDSNEEAEAIVAVCVAFFRDTQTSIMDTHDVAECCAAVVDIAPKDLERLVIEQEQLFHSIGKWSRFLEAVLYLRTVCNDDRLRALLGLFMNVSLSDGRYEHSENRLIFSLGKIWDLHAEEATRPSSWSVLRASDSVDGDGWTSIHDLAVLYIGLAHQTDRELAGAEIAAVNKKLSEWLPESLPVDVNRIVQTAMTTYSNGNHDGMLRAALESVEKSVPSHQRSAVLNDLMFIARADNVVLVEEREVISRLAEAWGIDPSTIE